MQKLALALIVVGAATVAYLFLAGESPRLEGGITEVRTLSVEPTASVAIVNFEAANVTNRPFVAYDRRLELVDADGRRIVGKIVQGPDLQLLFEYYSALGAMRDEPFLHEATIEAGETRRGLLAARFEVPEDALKSRSSFILRLSDGAAREVRLSESAPQS